MVIAGYAIFFFAELHIALVVLDDINVYQGIQSMIVNFSVTNMPLYNLIMVDSNGNEINSNSNNKDNLSEEDKKKKIIIPEVKK